MAAMSENNTYTYEKMFMKEHIELTINAVLLYTQSMQRSSTRWRDILAIILLAVILFTGSVRLVATEWTPDLNLIEKITLWGILLGLALGFSQFKKTGIILLTLGYSLLLIPWQISSILDHELLVVERLTQLSDRLNLAWNLFFIGQPADEYLIFIAVMSLLFWSISIYTSYTLIRYQNSIAALLPVTVVIVAIQYYDNNPESPLWMLGFYFFFVLLLLGRLNYLQNKKRWKKENVFVFSDERLDISIITSIAITIILLLAWNIPSSSAEWKSVSRWWQKTSHRFTTSRENIKNLFSAIDMPPIATSNVLYGAELPLGQRAYQGDSEMMIVQVPNLEPAPPRFYWRVRSYDTYLNGSWTMAAEETTEYITAQTELNLPISPESVMAEFTFTNKAETRAYLVTGQQPIWMDVNTEAVYTRLPDNTLDLNLLRAKPQLLKEESYIVNSALVAPTVTQMRQAGTAYPDWVTERYLQLPRNLPESIHDLAAQLSGGQRTPYDIARTISNYLRTEISYSDEVPMPPRNKEPLEWFLFTWKEGFCNYAASAEVILLRASGIPARLVVGFAQGKRNETGDFVVLQKNAHAWPEVYFPEIGWVEFEPTLNQALLLRPFGEDSADDELNDMLSLGSRNANVEEEPPLPEEEDIALPEIIDLAPEAERPISSIWGMITLIVAALFGIWYFNRKQFLLTRGLRFVVQVYERNNISTPPLLIRWMRWSEAMPITRAFHGVNISLGLLGEKIPLHLTPQERANALAKLIPAKEEEINALLAEHQKSLFTPDEGDLKIARRTSLAIRWHALKSRISSL